MVVKVAVEGEGGSGVSTRQVKAQCSNYLISPRFCFFKKTLAAAAAAA